MFLAFYTGCLLLVYWNTSEKERPLVLSVGSLFILFWWDFPSAVWMVALSLIVWLGARKESLRKLLIIGLLLQLILVRLFLPISPLGLSFSTLCLIHYIIDQKKKNFPVHSLPSFLSWCYFFPIFSAGPIEKLDHFLNNQSPHPDWVQGFKRIIFGMIKKWILVEWLLASWGPELLLEQGLSFSFLELWLGLLILFLKLYLDFSAYCDLAIGASHLFGFTIIENFNFPLFSSNISDFWKRWHISLSLWCQQYIYLPLLGITRNPYISILTTFLLMGLWHDISWQWICWGLWHGIGLMIHLRWKRFSRDFGWKDSIYWRLTSIILTILFVSVTGVFTQLNEQENIKTSFLLLSHSLGIWL